MQDEDDARGGAIEELEELGRVAQAVQRAIGAPVVAEEPIVRLLRVATRLCKLGAPIAAILVRGELRPRSRTIATFTPQDLAARDPTAPPPTFRPVIEEPMAMVCGAESVAGNLVELELVDRGDGATIVERIDGDYFAVMGLPLGRMITLLTELGVRYGFGPLHLASP